MRKKYIVRWLTICITHVTLLEW